MLTIFWCIYFGVLIGIGSSFAASTIYFLFVHPIGTTMLLGRLTAMASIAISIVLTFVCSILVMLASLPFATPKFIWLAFQRVFGNKLARKASQAPHLSQNDVIVHMVHGTFEKNANWIKDGSAISNKIHVRNPAVKFSSFQWSGSNFESSRRRAADQLAERICDIGSNKQFIVAHSHGGNIVRDMFNRYPSVAKNIAGVCLLSTPFIFRKSLERKGESLITMHMFGLLFFSQIICISLYSVCGFDLAMYPIYGLVIAVASLVADYNLGKYFNKSITDEIKHDQSNQVECRNVEIYQAIGDEADVALRFISALHEVCFSILGDISDANKIFRNNVKWNYLIAFIIQVVLLVAALKLSSINSQIIIYSSFIGVLISVCWCLFFEFKQNKDITPVLIFASLPVAIVGYLLNFIKAFAYGDLRLIFCPEIFIHSSETPVGDHKLIKFAPDDDRLLNHSTHSHSKAILDVSSWLKFRLGEM
jgi:hypothetical protein